MTRVFELGPPHYVAEPLARTTPFSLFLPAGLARLLLLFIIARLARSERLRVFHCIVSFIISHCSPFDASCPFLSRHLSHLPYHCLYRFLTVSQLYNVPPYHYHGRLSLGQGSGKVWPVIQWPPQTHRKPSSGDFQPKFWFLAFGHPQLAIDKLVAGRSPDEILQNRRARTPASALTLRARNTPGPVANPGGSISVDDGDDVTPPPVEAARPKMKRADTTLPDLNTVLLAMTEQLRASQTSTHYPGIGHCL